MQEPEIYTNERKQRMKNDLENHIDRYGVDKILTTLSEICYEKVEYIQVNWQDFELAKSWERAAENIASITIEGKRNDM